MNCAPYFLFLEIPSLELLKTILKTEVSTILRKVFHSFSTGEKSQCWYDLLGFSCERFSERQFSLDILANIYSIMLKQINNYEWHRRFSRQLKIYTVILFFLPCRKKERNLSSKLYWAWTNIEKMNIFKIYECINMNQYTARSRLIERPMTQQRS